MFNQVKCEDCGIFLDYDNAKAKWHPCALCGKEIILKAANCSECKQPLHWDEKLKQYDSCDCLYKKTLQKETSIADQFENDIEGVIYKYTDQGVTIGTMIGAL